MMTSSLISFHPAFSGSGCYANDPFALTCLLLLASANLREAGRQAIAGGLRQAVSRLPLQQYQQTVHTPGRLYASAQHVGVVLLPASQLVQRCWLFLSLSASFISSFLPSGCVPSGEIASCLKNLRVEAA